MDVRLAVNFTALVAIFLALEPASGRQFSAECLKDVSGRGVCATSDPDARVRPPAGMSGHVGCTMSCTLDERCRHFNYVPYAAEPCHLFYAEPTSFVESSECQHYRSRSTVAGALGKCCTLSRIVTREGSTGSAWVRKGPHSTNPLLALTVLLSQPTSVGG